MTFKVSQNSSTQNNGAVSKPNCKTANNLGDEGARALSEALKANTTLATLYLPSEARIIQRKQQRGIITEEKSSERDGR